MKSLASWSLLVALITALSLGTVSAHAQKLTGTISGTVTDASGAAVPGAVVTVTNTATSQTFNATTDSHGNYTLAELPDSVYDVKISATNFKEFRAQRAIVHVATTTTVDAQLQLGSVTETITVQANALQVQTDSAALGATVDGTQVKELPLNGRNFVQLTQLQPGVSAANGFQNTGKGLNGGVDMSVNGNPTTNNLFMVDGVNNNDTGSNRTILIYPSNEAIAEFKMLLNSYGPEYGQASGSVISIITRSGTNAFHGSVFYNGRNDALNTYTYFSAPNAGKGLPLNGKDKQRRNDWGYSIGGPILKQKLFFFWSQEWNHEIKGRQVSACVPTAAERAGDFSVLGCNTSGSPNFSAVPAGDLAGPLQLAAVDPSAATMMEMLPLPTTPNGALNSNGQNWSASLPTALNWRQENIRADYDLNHSNRIMGRYTQDTWTNPAFNAGYWGDTVYPALNSNWAQPSKSITAHWTATIRSTLVNDAAFNYSNNRITITPGGTNPGLLTQVTAAVPTLYPESLKHAALGVPQVNFGSYGGNTTMQAPWQNQLDIYSFRDDLSWVKGQHNVKFGALFGFNGKNEDVNSATGERPSVGGSIATPSGGIDTNDTLANLELPGNVFNINETSTNVRAQLRWRDYEFYAGDTWRVSPRVTLNLGVRYSLLFAAFQPEDQITSFQPQLYDPSKPASDACNGLWVAPGKDPCGDSNTQFGTNFSHGTPGPNRSLVKNGYNHFAPRIGVAWDALGSGTTVFRAGVGQFFQRERVSRYTLVANAPFALTTNNYPRTLGGATPSSLSGTASPAGGEDPSAILPNSWQWNLAVEQQLAKSTIFQMAYVGNRGIHLTNSYDINSITPANWMTATFANSGDVNLLRPFPAGGNNGTLNYWARGGDSNYNGLQVSLHTRIGDILQLGAAYTWSHALTNVVTDDSSGGTGNQMRTYYTMPRLDYGASTVNRPNMFVANAIWFLPKLQGSSALMQGMLGGWEVATIVTSQNGNNFTIFQGAHENNLGTDPLTGTTYSSQLNQSGALVQTGFTSPLRPLLTGQSCVSGRHDNTIINPGAFTLIGYALGTIPSNMAQRGICGGPNFNNTDMSLDKSWPLFHEKATIKFSMDFFNLFNHPNFNPASLSQGSPISAVNCGGAIGANESTGHALYAPCSATNNIISSQDLQTGFGTSSGLIGNARQIQYGLHINF